MRKYFRPSAIVLTVVATIISTVLRIFLTPNMQDIETGNFHISYVIIGFMLITMAAIAVLVLAGKGNLTHTNNMSHYGRMPMAVSGVFFGFVLLISSLFDGWKWMSYDKTPPPNQAVISRLDSIALTFTLMFGIIAGLFLIWLGIKLGSGGTPLSPAFGLGALTPVIWIWIRLVRYEVSYASAIPVEQSFYDFVMLIFTMLFLFAFARYISKTGERPKPLLIFSLITAMLSISGPVSTVAFFMLDETEAYNASRLAGISDISIGIFAFCTALTLVFARQISQPKDEYEDDKEIVTEGEFSGDPAEESVPTVDEILSELKIKGVNESTDENLLK